MPDLVGVLSLFGAGCLGAILMMIVLGLGVGCYVCKERRTGETLREKEREIVKRRSKPVSNTTTAIRGQI